MFMIKIKLIKAILLEIIKRVKTMLTPRILIAFSLLTLPFSVNAELTLDTIEVNADAETAPKLK